jgi:prophage regulatory protein
LPTRANLFGRFTREEEAMAVEIERLPMVKRRTELSTSTIYDMMAKGRFPRPIELASTQSVGWIKSEVDAWLEQRITARDTRRRGGRRPSKVESHLE